MVTMAVTPEAKRALAIAIGSQVQADNIASKIDAGTSLSDFETRTVRRALASSRLGDEFAAKIAASTSLSGDARLAVKRLVPGSAMADRVILEVETFDNTLPADRIATHRAPRLFVQLQESVATVATWNQCHFYDIIIVDCNAPTTSGPTVNPPPSLYPATGYLGRAGAWRISNPNTVVLGYVSSSDVWPVADLNVNTVFEAYLTNNLPAAYKLKDVAGADVTLHQFASTQYSKTINLTVAASWLANAVYSQAFATNFLDGVFWDWILTDLAATLNYETPDRHGRLDLNNDGVAEADSDLNAQWIAAQQNLFTLSRALLGQTRLVCGNSGWGIKLNTHEPYLNGVMLEQFLEGPNTDPTNYSWSQQMRVYLSFGRAGVAPRVPMVMSNHDTATNYDYARFGLCSALLGDGYFTFTNRTGAYNEARWLDEFAVNATTGAASKSLNLKGWLGAPLGEAYDANNPSRTLWSQVGTGADNFLWRREYTNGVVFCNPSASTQAISLEKTHRRITGSLETTVNNGAIANSLSLASQRGIILLRAS